MLSLVQVIMRLLIDSVTWFKNVIQQIKFFFITTFFDCGLFTKEFFCYIYFETHVFCYFLRKTIKIPFFFTTLLNRNWSIPISLYAISRNLPDRMTLQNPILPVQKLTLKKNINKGYLHRKKPNTYTTQNSQSG